MAQPFDFENGNGLGDLNNLSGEESEDENREDEIKQLLAEAFSNETFEDGSENSFLSSDQSKIPDKSSNDSSIHSYHASSNTSLAHSHVPTTPANGFAFVQNGHNTTVIPNQNQHEMRPHIFSNGRQTYSRADDVANGRHNGSREIERGVSAGHGDQFDSVSHEIEDNNKTVSIIHKTHCPQLVNGGEGDTNGNDENWTSTPINKMEQLQTLNSYRERQLVRSEETISALTKDKRALNHQIGLMRTEMIQMKGVFDDTEKALKLKEEEVEFLKSKIQEAIVDYETLKRGEKELKDENLRLVSQIGRFEQEVKLLSTIGTSAQHAEVDSIVRQIRDRHAQEIISYKTEVSNLEAELRSYKRHFNEKQIQESSTQTDLSKNQLVQTSCTQTSPFVENLRIFQQLQSTESKCTQTLAGECKIGNGKLDKSEAKHPSMKKTEVRTTQTFVSSTQNSTQTMPLNVVESSTSVNSSTTEVQTDETLKTYEILGGLIEKWAAEVSESTKRAELAESQVQFTEVSLRKLREKFKSLYKMTSFCRQKWKKQEEFLKKMNEDTKTHYLNVLLKLQAKFDGLEFVENNEKA